jgi:hypothetical protein
MPRPLRRICDTEFETALGSRRIIATKPTEWYVTDQKACVISGPFRRAADAAEAVGAPLPIKTDT